MTYLFESNNNETERSVSMSPNPKKWLSQSFCAFLVCALVVSILPIGASASSLSESGESEVSASSESTETSQTVSSLEEEEEVKSEVITFSGVDTDLEIDAAAPPVDLNAALLDGVSAVDEKGEAAEVYLKDNGGFTLEVSEDTSFTITYGALHPVTKEEFTDTRTVKVIAVKAPPKDVVNEIAIESTVDSDIYNLPFDSNGVSMGGVADNTNVKYTQKIKPVSGEMSLSEITDNMLKGYTNQAPVIKLHLGGNYAGEILNPSSGDNLPAHYSFDAVNGRFTGPDGTGAIKAPDGVSDLYLSAENGDYITVTYYLLINHVDIKNTFSVVANAKSNPEEKITASITRTVRHAAEVFIEKSATINGEEVIFGDDGVAVNRYPAGTPVTYTVTVKAGISGNAQTVVNVTDTNLVGYTGEAPVVNMYRGVFNSVWTLPETPLTMQDGKHYVFSPETGAFNGVATETLGSTLGTSFNDPDESRLPYELTLYSNTIDQFTITYTLPLNQGRNENTSNVTTSNNWMSLQNPSTHSVTLVINSTVPPQDPSGDESDPGDTTPPADPPATPPANPPVYEDEGTPPDPATPGNTLEPGDDNNYIEIDSAGVPTGEWTWDDAQQEWIYDSYVPLAKLPTTGLSSETKLWKGLLLISLTGLAATAALGAKKRFKAE